MTIKFYFKHMTSTIYFFAKWTQFQVELNKCP